MLVTKMALPRRTFLRGLGAAVALPLVDAMVPAFTATAATAARGVRRLGFVYIPMGMNPALWVPTQEGRLGELSPSLAALTPSLDHLTDITNLELRNANTTGNHATANCAFLSCARAKRTRREANMIRCNASRLTRSPRTTRRPRRCRSSGRGAASRP